MEIGANYPFEGLICRTDRPTANSDKIGERPLNALEFTILTGLSSLVAGFLGSLTGLGGGVVIVPLLALVFGVDISYAIGASLVSVIATSSGAAAAYVKEGYSNIRIGMFLEIATTNYRCTRWCHPSSEVIYGGDRRSFWPGFDLLVLFIKPA
jgi:hypothetical protein